MAEDVGSGSRIVNPEWLARVNEQTTRPSSGGGGSSDRAIIPGPEQPGYREIVGRGSRDVILPGDKGVGESTGDAGGGRGGGGSKDTGGRGPDFDLPKKFSELQEEIELEMDKHVGRPETLQEILQNNPRLVALITERTKMVGEADKVGLFKKTRAKVFAVIKSSSGLNVYHNIQAEKPSLSSDVKSNRTYKPEWEGMVDTVIDGAALQGRYAAIKKFVPKLQWKNFEIDPEDPTSPRITDFNDPAVIREAQKVWAKKSILSFKDEIGVNGENIAKEAMAAKGAAAAGSTDFAEAMKGFSRQFADMANQFGTQVADLMRQGQRGQDAMMDALRQSQDQLRNALDTTLATNANALADILQQAAAQTAMLSEFNRRDDPDDEREAWTDVMIKEGLYGRFQPGLGSPEYYRKLSGDKDKKDTYDNFLQVNRAVYVKLVTSTHPEEWASERNNDFLGLSNEQIKNIYEKMPGARQMMETYAQALVNKTRLRLSSGEQYSIWECDEARFAEFRGILRGQVERDSRQRIFQGYMAREVAQGTITQNEAVLKAAKKARIEAKEADVAGLGLLSLGLLPEYLNSRFVQNGAGERYNLPRMLGADEYATILHFQEKAESKAATGEEFGAFGRWWQVQVGRIKSELAYNRDEDEIVFDIAPSKKDFWKASRAGRKWVVEPDGSRREKNVILVKTPDCYASTSVTSMWAANKVTVGNREKTLLDCLLAGETIPWGQLEGGRAANFVARVDKGYKLSEYCQGRVPLDSSGINALFQKGDHQKVNALLTEWVSPLFSVFDKGVPVKRNRDLEAWLIFASRGGVREPNKEEFTSPFVEGFIGSDERQLMQTELSNSRYRKFWGGRFKKMDIS